MITDEYSQYTKYGKKKWELVARVLWSINFFRIPTQNKQV